MMAGRGRTWLHQRLLLLLVTHAAYSLKITPPEAEFTYPSGSSIILKCDHEESIAWSYPRTEDPDHITVTEQIFNDDSFEATLTVHGARYTDVGFYTCASESASKASQSIYVSVRDLDHLLVGPDLQFINHDDPYKEIVIPCIPSFPEVNVTLFIDGVNAFETPGVTYDYKKGFTFPQLHDSNLFCTGTSGKKSSSINFPVTIVSPPEDIDPPEIKLVSHPSGSNVVVGQNVILQCTVAAEPNSLIHLYWEKPNNDSRITEEYSVRRRHNGGGQFDRVGTSLLTIVNVSIVDEASYTCVASNQAKHRRNTTFNLRVFDDGHRTINLTMQGNPTVQVRAGTSEAVWIVQITGHPPPKIFWSNPKGELMTSDNFKYTIINTMDATKVKVHRLNIIDSGVYNLRAVSDGETKKLSVMLLVEGPPQVTMLHTKPLYFLNEVMSVICHVISYPSPKVMIHFQACPYDSHPSCKNDYRPETSLNVYRECVNISCNYTAQLTIKKNGMLTCRAQNYLDREEKNKFIYVTDVEGEFNIFDSIPHRRTPITDLDTVKINCGASKHKYTSDMTWTFTNRAHRVQNIDSTTPGITLNDTTSEFSYWSSLEITDPTPDMTGTYECSAKNIWTNSTEMKQYSLEIITSEPPVFLDGKDHNKTVKTLVPLGGLVEWFCNITGVPTPKILWFKDDELITETDSIKMSHRNRSMKIAVAVLRDEGRYKCLGINNKGSVSANFKLKINIQRSKWEGIIIIGSLLIVAACFILVIFLCRKVKHEKRLRKDTMNSTDLGRLLEGQTEIIDNTKSVTEQADLLPYDKKWEFPRDKLKLGKQLGSGAFGVVMKAEAEGIIDGEDVTIVAVKMVKKNSDFAKIKALASELKIMSHLGQHLNVLNLLGACTSKITNRELLVIVEYCKYGNLHQYLISHRSLFINQVNPGSGNIEVSRDGIGFVNDGAEVTNSMYRKTNSNYYTGGSNGQTVNTDMTVLSTPIGDDGYLMTKDMVENYQGDYKEHRTICTQDLLCWGYQIAKGMEYLATRKIFHGDLAARNILLADENIVKICDFGLARSLYQDDMYMKKGDDLLPVRWLSIEALRDRRFSTQSDIWAFGIVLWELFSLAKTPYPGVEMGDKFFDKLLHGYRLGKPEYASEDVYNLMYECWREQPMLRPSFSESAERLGNMLEESVKQHYIDLNDYYIKFNNNQTGQIDYLSMLTAPTYTNCVAMAAGENPYVREGYIDMKNKNNRNEKDGDEMELTPMLVPDKNRPPGPNSIETDVS